jgi:hypothetical protein
MVEGRAIDADLLRDISRSQSFEALFGDGLERSLDNEFAGEVRVSVASVFVWFFLRSHSSSVVAPSWFAATALSPSIGALEKHRRSAGFTGVDQDAITMNLESNSKDAKLALPIEIRYP